MPGFSEKSVWIGEMQSSDAGYLYVNVLQGDIPTGIRLHIGLPLAAALAAGSWLAVIKLRRRKAEREETAA